MWEGERQFLLCWSFLGSLSAFGVSSTVLAEVRSAGSWKGCLVQSLIGSPVVNWACDRTLLILSVGLCEMNRNTCVLPMPLWDGTVTIKTVKILNANASKCEVYFCRGGTQCTDSASPAETQATFPHSVHSAVLVLCSVALVFGAF